MERFSSLLIYLGIGFACLAFFEGAAINWSNAWTYGWVLGWPIGLLLMFGKWILIGMAAAFAFGISIIVYDHITGK